MTIQSHIIGLGGIFFKSEDPEALTAWYAKTLGFYPQVPYMEGDDIITFKWKDWDNNPRNTVWAPFPKDTTYFEPSTKQTMFNYIVRDLDGLIQKLQEMDVETLYGVKEQPFGRFAAIIDPEGNKLEFMEPNPDFFNEKYG